MDALREVDAYCASCDHIRHHAVMDDDPSSCFCNVCGSAQPLMVPVTEVHHRARGTMAAS